MRFIRISNWWITAKKMDCCHRIMCFSEKASMLKKKYRFVIDAITLAVLSACDGSGNTVTAPVMSVLSSSSVYTTPVSSSSSSRSYEATDDLVRSTSSSSLFNAPPISYGLLVDSRDGQVYKTVNIGTQTWMAENLNYKVQNSWCGGGSNYDEGDCSVYGRLYTWATTMGKTEDECGYGNSCDLGLGNVQGVCPDGWHVPTLGEWQDLFVAVDGNTAGQQLKATTLWVGEGDITNDAYGFSAFPAGYKYRDRFSNVGHEADFWSATQISENGAYRIELYYAYDYAKWYNYNKYFGFSVRCLKSYGSSNPSSSSAYSSPSSSSAYTLLSSSASIVYGSLVDTRDGQVYKTVDIGTQTWMAQNLNYVVGDSSYCYDDEPSNCTKYGRLYTYTAAVTACPNSWHLPSKDEWEALFAAVDGMSTAGLNLKAASGWNDDANGTDVYSFSALPAGFMSFDGNFSYVGIEANFWSASQNYSFSAYFIYLYGNDNAVLGDTNKYNGLSVRCVKD